ncbi:MAG: SRPBCC domain-containing protein [Archangium sp.]
MSRSFKLRSAQVHTVPGMNTITATLYIAAKPDAVFDALTKKDGVAALYFGSRLESSFEKGAPYEYIGPDGKGGEVVHVEGEVLAYEPGKRFVVRHRAGPAYQKGPKIFSSRVAYEVKDHGWATQLTVVHDEIEADDPGYEHNKDGWVIFVSSVKSYVETGKALPPPSH